MKTSIAKKEATNTKWYIIDAKDVVLGKLATVVANKLRGKDKPIFSPHMDCGDFVIITNTAKIKLTGKKWSDKMYARHSGYPSGYKEECAEDLNVKKPTKIVELAVSGMLPKNKLRKPFMLKLKLYAGEEHPHAAQNPEKLEI